MLELFENVLSADGRLPSGKLLPPGRIVFLGSPVQGSSAAQHLARLPFGRSIMGLTANEVLLAPRERRWSGARDLGVIAGNLPLGLGRLVGPLDGPNDGTVLVDETRLPGATAASDAQDQSQLPGVFRRRLRGRRRRSCARAGFDTPAD